MKKSILILVLVLTAFSSVSVFSDVLPVRTVQLYINHLNTLDEGDILLPASERANTIYEWQHECLGYAVVSGYASSNILNTIVIPDVPRDKCHFRYRGVYDGQPGQWGSWFFKDLGTSKPKMDGSSVLKIITR